MSGPAVFLALDLGVKTGFAYGTAGSLPTSGTVELKRHTEPRGVAFSNLICFLNEYLAEIRPAWVIKEGMLNLQAFKNLGNAANTVIVTAGFHAIAEAMCIRFGIACEDVHDSRIRRHFIGQARMGTRPETKAATVKRAQLLGYMPKDQYDEDRADALATWDFAAATYGRAAPHSLHLFGEDAA